ncbi:hypothetical protein BLA60_08055 [Actinophytocola xinjiangensis]|uniref:RNA polymerase sigma-70 factor (ECF subfamily) n=1 Tax=Actinophytocola xinjiangensis TaxID=485602 RepID=A0A7Z1AZD6_9PSEU|nr:DUF6596 domain-containing protein [Actinophytocola xinjiangensis]OLF11978.1 hypothetical protein BLA60_08055 [Actinophytocola xinjiangensis]
MSEAYLPADPVVDDDRLRLIFLCCHPALPRDGQIALTLRMVCGMRTADIAALFLVPETTMATRIALARQASTGLPFEMPPASALPDRVDAVLTVLHLLFTAGHTAPSSDTLTREDLAGQAVGLARALHALMPDEREVGGLLALLLLTHARRATRTDADGRLLLLDEQDRSRWDRATIAQGYRLVVHALRAGPPGRFALQAAIAALHATAPTYADTDWEQLLDRYDQLLVVWPSPVVALNRTVVVAMVDGVAAALVALTALERDPNLARSHYLPSVKADFLRRLGRYPEAVAAYRVAAGRTGNRAEREFLAGRIAECQAC